MIKGCNSFLGQKLLNTCSFVGGRIIATRKNLKSRTQLDEPIECPLEAIHYSFIKFCIYCFSLWYEFFLHNALRVEKIINMALMRDLWNFSFCGRGDVSLTHSELLLCFGVISKTPGLMSHNNIVKKMFVCIGHHDNVLARCDSIFPLFRCQEVWNKRAHNFVFSKFFFRIRRTTVLGMFKDSAIILDAI